MQLLQKRFLILLPIMLMQPIAYGQKNIKDLDFLIGKWEVKEENDEKSWWEKGTRTGSYILNGTYIELVTNAVSSVGKERTYRWLIHLNSESKQFEMVSVFSNWHKVQFDYLEWDATKRKLVIRNKPDSSSYHERLGEITFNPDFTEYVWEGENKSGDKDSPKIWRYKETGKKN